MWRNATLNDFYSGANSNADGVPVGLAIGSRILGLDDRGCARRIRAGNLNYLLGINPLQMSYITGHGERRVTKTVHEVYNTTLFGYAERLRAGGPNNNGRYTLSGQSLQRFFHRLGDQRDKLLELQLSPDLVGCDIIKIE